VQRVKRLSGAAAKREGRLADSQGSPDSAAGVKDSDDADLFLVVLKRQNLLVVLDEGDIQWCVDEKPGSPMLVGCAWQMA